MENKKQTAVEWLAEQVKSTKWAFADVTDRNTIIEQAKQMEKEQIENAWYAGDEDGAIHEFEQYYNETYSK